MQRIAKKFGGALAFDDGECFGNVRIGRAALCQLHLRLNKVPRVAPDLQNR
jgi:hypothetical protein